MSLILDALRKSERERLGEVDSVAPLIVRPGQARHQPKFSSALIKIAAISVALIVVVIAVYFVKEQFSVAPVEERQETNSSSSNSMRDRREAPVELIPEARNKPQRVPQQSVPIEPSPKVIAPQPVAVAPMIEQRTEPEVAVSEESRMEKPVPVPKIEPDPVAATPEPENSAKPLSRMPADFRRSVSPLHLNVHVFDEEAENRYVFINGNEYIEGSSIKPGLDVIEILQGGVLMRFRGTEFLLTIGD